MPTRRITPGPEEFKILEPFGLERWMCPNCGLIFDFGFGQLDGEHGWPEINTIGPTFSEGEPEEYSAEMMTCPRCGISLDKHPLLSIIVGSTTHSSFQKTTFLVEDDKQRKVIKAIGQQLKSDIPVIVLGDKAQIKMSFKVHQSEGTLKNAYFLIDGDNEGNAFPDEENFIHLDKYCIENYLLDLEVCAQISGKSMEEVRARIFELIKKKRESILKGGNRFLRFFYEILQVEDISAPSFAYFDAGLIFDDFLKEVMDLSRDRFMDKYIARCFSSGMADRILPKRLMEIARGAASGRITN